MLLSVFLTLTAEAQIVHNDNVEIEKSDGAKLDLTHTGVNKTWQLISGLYGGFQIGYLTGGLTGNTAPFIIKENGYIGMLMTSPNNILDPLTVNGNIRIFDANAGIKLGSKPFISAPSSNTFLGVDAGINIGSGTKNVFVGYGAGKNNTVGNENLFLGNGAGENNTTGNYNTFMGRFAGANNLDGDNNLFLGRLSGLSNVSGSNNLYMGASAGRSNTASQNVFLGSEAGFATTASNGNVLVGYNSGRNVNSTVGRNTYLGAHSGGSSSNGDNNVAVGYEAGKGLQGVNNVAIGVGAGSSSNAQGNNNVFIGYNAGVGDGNSSNRLYIGNDQVSTSAGKLIYGEFDNGKVGINTTNLEANSTLTVGGKVAATEYLLADGSPLLGSITTPWTVNASDITFATGKVGIGTTGPDANLDVRGSGNVAQFGNSVYEDQYISIRNNTTGGLLGIAPTTDGGVFQFQSGNNKGMRFMVDGDATGTAWSTGVNAMEIAEDGRIGINTTTLDANSALTVEGQVTADKISLTNSSSNVSMQMESVNGKNTFIAFKEQNTSGQAVWKGGVSWNSVKNAVLLDSYDGGNIVLRNNSGGNVGIGEENPTEKLEVNGNTLIQGDLEAMKVKVTATPGQGWPDYVFEPEFKLRPLSEVEAFVKDNKHLPEVPSAKEVEAKGIDLGNMDATLLKKVEELTLYMIEMNKKIEKLEKENKQLKELVKKDK